MRRWISVVSCFWNGLLRLFLSLVSGFNLIVLLRLISGSKWFSIRLISVFRIDLVDLGLFSNLLDGINLGTVLEFLGIRYIRFSFWAVEIIEISRSRWISIKLLPVSRFDLVDFGLILVLSDFNIIVVDGKILGKRFKRLGLWEEEIKMGSCDGVMWVSSPVGKSKDPANLEGCFSASTTRWFAGDRRRRALSTPPWVIVGGRNISKSYDVGRLILDFECMEWSFIGCNKRFYNSLISGFSWLDVDILRVRISMVICNLVSLRNNQGNEGHNPTHHGTVKRLTGGRNPLNRKVDNK
ncbi:predicted protein [Arabidopsis lyrata subsp. lyrata]|uniref:Predicted protein n=1 Tax=Arabidopsis lyrata subsp. lyrata TaxID=81972 RepID=D7KXF9_ARALL|nr:predicted protein [Arabidopsis lyrata subsp. lyrata]